MASPQLSSTVIDYVDHSSSNPGPTAKRSWLSSVLPPSSSSNRVNESSQSLEALAYVDPLRDDIDVDPEFKLPSVKSLFVVIGGNALFQLSFFIIVSSASAYAEYLGGSATFSGLIIGIPTLFSGMALIFVAKYDGGQYHRALNIAYAAMIVGSILHALAYRANWLYLILIGRMVSGIGFTSFMFSKRYCSDPRIVGIRRRTTLASWLVIGQAFGFSAGPFLGGLLYKVGFSNNVFNGYTSPGWVMAGVWVIFTVASKLLFEDVGKPSSELIKLRAVSEQGTDAPLALDGPSSSATNILNDQEETHRLTARQWGVVICMCYYSMTCFFILGGWESNIPIFSAIALGYSPYNAGNFIAIGGITTFPFLLLNVRYARRIQDRVTLATGSALGLAGLVIMLAILQADKVSFGTFYVCWVLVALGFNLASTCTLSLLSKQLPDTWNGKISMAIQYSNYAGRLTGAIMGGAGVKMGMSRYIGVQIAIVGIGGLMHLTLWRELKAKTG
ncbi:membrane transporter [Crucibulum laeve]|uniref:Membrane transporter n=1 Tax=Crucibulum laeve TaxID=68775 RepID=A0A5C3LZM9_9AGAR|nr:membrane transporter [Crucibulum laeve]TFK38679.1 membrane transporter [Crucibulum laeve]